MDHSKWEVDVKQALKCKKEKKGTLLTSSEPIHILSLVPIESGVNVITLSSESSEKKCNADLQWSHVLLCSLELLKI